MIALAVTASLARVDIGTVGDLYRMDDAWLRVVLQEVVEQTIEKRNEMQKRD